MSNLAYYASAISDRISRTPEGYLLCIGVPICRTGIQEYLYSEIGASPQDGDKDGLIRVNRAEHEVFAPETLASFEGKPVTYNHPDVGRVDSNNYTKYQKGHMQNIRRGTLDNGTEVILADLLINDPALGRLVEDGSIREVSCGYDCEFVEDEMGWHQQGIRGNHVAVVKKGRAGDNIRIQDSQPEEMSPEEIVSLSNEILSNLNQTEEVDMGIEPNEKPEVIQSGEAPAAAPQQPEQQQKQDAEPQSQAPAPAAAQPKSPAEAFAEKLDLIIKMLEAVLPKQDETPAEAPAQEAPAAPPQEQQPKPEEAKDEDPESKPSEAESLIESMDACGNKDSNVACDAAPTREDVITEVMRTIAPSVSSIKNQAERKAVTDALRTLIKPSNTVIGDSVAIIEASHGNAINHIKKESNLEQRCEQAQAAYRSRNPHHKESK